MLVVTDEARVYTGHVDMAAFCVGGQRAITCTLSLSLSFYWHGCKDIDAVFFSMGVKLVLPLTIFLFVFA